MDTTPYWHTTAVMPAFPALAEDLHVDVAIIGGGITGLTAAYLLKRSGRRVAVLERGRCASADSGHTTAHLTCVTDVGLGDLVKTFGRDHAQAAWDAGLAAIMQIAAIVQAERLACEFDWVPGYLHAPIDGSGPDESETFKAEAELATDLGFDAAYLDVVPFVGRPGVRLDGQAKFHPVKYLSGLAALIPGQGSYVFEHTDVEEVTSDPITAKANGHRVTASYLVIATHVPIVGKTHMLGATLLQTKLYSYTSYVLGGYLPAGRVPEASFWDTAAPYHYLRVDRGPTRDYAIFGGEDHKTGQVDDTEGCYARLEATLRQILPEIDITHRWSGQVVETNDGLPFIGEESKGQFVGTGYAGNGMTFGTLAAMLACDAAIGRENPWRGLFDVGRTKVKGGLWDYVKENKDYPYYFLRDRFRGAEGRSLRAVSRGQGRIIDLDGKRLAASRSEDGLITAVSAVCTHMGCIVHWNGAERTWDCPCHGSRFAISGEVIAGPAETPLEKVEVGAMSGFAPKDAQ